MALKYPNKLVVFDPDLAIVSEIKIHNLTENIGLHGLAMSDDGFIYIAEARENKVYVFNSRTWEKEAELVLSNEHSDFHHINDLLVSEDDLYISMFSVIGNWKNRSMDTWDGAIVKFNRLTLEPIEVVVENLKAPHSIVFDRNYFYYCHSLRLNVERFDPIIGSSELVAQCNGFTRGLYVDNNVLLIGQSKMRHLQRINKWHKNISLDAGIYIYDLQCHVSRFMRLPVENVYSVLVLQNE